MSQNANKHHDVLGMIAAYAGGVLVTALIGVVIFGVRPDFMSSKASSKVDYIGPAVCDPYNSNPRCQTAKPAIISPVTLPSGVRGRAYQYQFQAQGGTAPYTWEVSTDGNLNWYPCCTIALQPNGLFSSSASPMTVAGTFQVGVRVTDSKGLSATSVHSFTINPENAGKPLTISGPSQLPDGQVGQSYYHQFEISGGTGPYVWALSSAIVPNPSYPAGCMRFSPTGVLAGCVLAPTMPYAGTYQVAVVLQDSSQTAQRTFTFKINPDPKGTKDITTITPTKRK